MTLQLRDVVRGEAGFLGEEAHRWLGDLPGDMVQALSHLQTQTHLILNASSHPRKVLCFPRRPDPRPH